MNKLTYILSALVLILSLWAVALWLLPFGDYKEVVSQTRYGIKRTTLGHCPYIGIRNFHLTTID